VGPLDRIRAVFAPGDGVSIQTKRALVEHGVLPAPEPIAAPAAPMGVGGPAPSPELLDRVRKAQEARSAESFKRLMEQRRLPQ
jgi:hypothetical protein